MRTTVTLDPDVDLLLKRLMRERDLSFKRAINQAIRDGLAGQEANREPFRTRTHDMGPPKVNLDKALQLAAEMEDEAMIRKLRAGR
jgi:hypothetical protein